MSFAPKISARTGGQIVFSSKSTRFPVVFADWRDLTTVPALF